MTQPAFTDTPVEDIGPIVKRVRAAYASGMTRGIDWRMAQLDALAKLLQNEQDLFYDALYHDVRKPKFEAFASEIALAAEDIRIAKKNLARWIQPESVRLPLLSGAGASAKITHQPLGTSLIIGAWNYPVMLTLGPLVGAIAAGCTAVIKPSELTENSAVAVESAMKKYLDRDAFAVVQGGVAQTTELLAQPFDQFFFTGSPAVGKVVMAAAAKELTPVVLELGGKSPVIVTPDADLEVAARRITWGKYFNAGQTCLGVDYVLVHECRYERFLKLVGENIRQFYGADPAKSPDYARIVNDRNVERIAALLVGQSIHTGGTVDRAKRYIAPTVVTDPDRGSLIMQEEIFGPIMPVIPYTDLDAELELIVAGEKPLACYVFSSDPKTQRYILDKVNSGGACINDTLTHVMVGNAPFGGVGHSGMGSYHGRDGYLAFTHRRTELTRSPKVDPSFRYPPYTSTKAKIMRALFR